MTEEAVKLHGTWGSPFSTRVIWALKLKGIPYENIEEDLSNKSPSLLKHNPIYKKIPVLVHAGNSICESMIIVQYLDETWPHNSLLPDDPYERALARFWLKFIEDKEPSMYSICLTKGEELEKTLKETIEFLEIIEEHAMVPEKKYMGGDRIGILDIAFGGIAHWLQVVEEVAGVKALQPNKFPRLYEWTNNFKEAPIIKDNLPDKDQLVTIFKRIREMRLASK